MKKLRLSSKVKKGDRITVEADATKNPDAVYELLDQIGKSMPLHLYNVTQVELTASVDGDTNKPPKAVTIRITHPNSCSLKYDELGLTLRDMLHASGIEPKEPEKERGSRRPMTPQAALIELLARVGARNGATVLVSAEELGQWPAAAVAAMKSQGLLAKARPAASAICPGCERECIDAGAYGAHRAACPDIFHRVRQAQRHQSRARFRRPTDAMAVRRRGCARIYRHEPRTAPQRSASCRPGIVEYRHRIR